MPIKSKGNYRYNNKSGFTLIELLIAIAVVIILASIAFFIGIANLKSASDTVRKSDLKSIENALMRYQIDNSKYPEPPTGLSYDSSGGENWIPELSPEYLKKVPADTKHLDSVIFTSDPVMASLFGATAPQGTNETWANTYGYFFIPNKNMKINSLGGYFNGTKKVTLWDNAGNVLAQTNITSTNAWTTTTIPTVQVTAGSTYWVGAYMAGSGTARFATAGAPSISTSNMTICGGKSYAGDANLGLNHDSPLHCNYFMGVPDIGILRQASTSGPSQYTYSYILSADKRTFVLWARLDRLDDPQINTKSTAKCQEEAPGGTDYNYCIKKSY